MSSLGFLKKINDNIGKIATVSGLLLLPFFGVAAAGYITAQGSAATIGGTLASFWSPLVTDPITGTMGIGEGLTRMFNGWAALGHSAYEVGEAGVWALSHGDPVFAAMGNALAMPAPPL